jgi:hypothetical protein
MQATVIERRRDGKKSSFADSVAYILSDRDEHRSRDKLSHYELVNLTSRETAAAEMTLTAGLSDRCADPLHHIVISWPEGEQPSRQQAQEAARHHVRRLVDAHNDEIRQAARRHQETGDRRHRPRGRMIDPDALQMVIAGHHNTRNSHVQRGLEPSGPDHRNGGQPRAGLDHAVTGQPGNGGGTGMEPRARRRRSGGDRWYAGLLARL